MKKIVFFTVFISFAYILSSFSSCSTSTSTSTQNISQMYKTDQNMIRPAFVVFHRTNTVSELHFKVNSKELLYSRQAGNENFTARISIHYRLISSYETKDIIDSATVMITDVYSNTAKDIIGKIDFNANFTNTYLLQVEMTDLNRNTTSKSFININKIDYNAPQNFLLLSKNKIPLFRNYVNDDERFFIHYRHHGEKLYVRYYNRDFPLPAPPYSMSNVGLFEYRADSIFTIQQDEKDTIGLNFRKQGFYHIQADTTSYAGFTVFRFSDGFPQVTRHIQLLQPLVYLTSKQEYKTLMSYKNIKHAVDSFWVFAGGSYDRARELVRKFYNRVEKANEYFTSHTEGWRTDRGLIYIVYGPPNIVYKSNDGENWVYGEENNLNSLTFSFSKVQMNPFTENDYRLDRSPVFRTGWHMAVEMWRQGRVYAEK